jgi:hypothetical protein
LYCCALRASATARRLAGRRTQAQCSEMQMLVENHSPQPSCCWLAIGLMLRCLLGWQLMGF